MLRLAMKLAVSVSAAVALGVMGAPLASAATADTATDATTVKTVAQVKDQAAPAWSYNIRPSCSGWQSPIRTGANYWGGASEGGGTPVECQSSGITDCGFEPIKMETKDGRMMVVGCNYGQGQLIRLVPGAVNDPALLAAHEFGHNWYGHSYNGCASWASPYDVMATTMC